MTPFSRSTYENVFVELIPCSTWWLWVSVYPALCNSCMNVQFGGGICINLVDYMGINLNSHTLQKMHFSITIGSSCFTMSTSIIIARQRVRHWPLINTNTSITRSSCWCILLCWNILKYFCGKWEIIFVYFFSENWEVLFGMSSQLTTLNGEQYCDIFIELRK